MTFALPVILFEASCRGDDERGRPSADSCCGREKLLWIVSLGVKENVNPLLLLLLPVGLPLRLGLLDVILGLELRELFPRMETFRSFGS